MPTIFSFDVESDGLYGTPFAVGVFIKNTYSEDRYVFRTEHVVQDQYVIENVLPAIAHIKPTHTSLQALCQSFFDLLMLDVKAHPGLIVCGHVINPVETNFLRLLVDFDPSNRMWKMPYPIHEIGTALRMKRHNPQSVDDYAKEFNIIAKGKVHDPMYDAEIAGKVMYHLLTN